MLQNKLTRIILGLLLIIITVPLGYSVYTNGESIFPTNDVEITYTATYATSTKIAPTHTVEIRQSETAYSDVSPTYTITPLTTPTIYVILTPTIINSDDSIQRQK